MESPKSVRLLRLVTLFVLCSPAPGLAQSREERRAAVLPMNVLDTAARDRTANRHAMEHSRKCQVINIECRASDLPATLFAREGLADEMADFGAHEPDYFNSPSEVSTTPR